MTKPDVQRLFQHKNKINSQAMNELHTEPPRTHLRGYLAAGYALFIVYASLSPFSGWREQGLSLAEVMGASLKLTFTWFDFSVNLLAYLPLGFFLAMMVRSRFLGVRGVLLTVVLGALLSLLLEYVQMYLPARVSSGSDVLSNSAGTLCGALLAGYLASHATYMRLQQWHAQWFSRGHVSDVGLALLALWMFAQINPSLPMLGSVFISELAHSPFEVAPVSPFSWLECIAVALNLLMPGVLLLTLLREPRYAVNVLLLTLGVVTLMKFLVAALLLKSWALLLWLNSEAIFGIFAGVLLVLAARHLSRRSLVLVAAVAVIAYMVLVYRMMGASAPEHALRLYHWRYGHMLNYNALSQLVALAFPLLQLGYLWLVRSK
jgi:glycopeptide antibiotics resistance protein